MKTNYTRKFAALAALLGAALSVHAANVISIGTGDLILGFQDATNSIQFKVSNVSALSAMDGATTDLGSFSINTALSYTGSGTTGYGAGWASNSGISWTVFGKDANNFYASMGQSAPVSTLGGGAATANSTLVVPGDTTAAQSSISTMISAMANEPTSVALKAGGATTLAAKYVNTSTASVNTIDKAGTTASAFGNAFQNASLLNTTVTTTATGTAGLLNGLSYSAVDLYSFTNAGAGVNSTFLGTLALTSGGELFFVSAVSAIPEPTTYAMILGVATLGFAAIRRRKQANLLA